jgi:hypothetical protein
MDESIGAVVATDFAVEPQRSDARRRRGASAAAARTATWHRAWIKKARQWIEVLQRPPFASIVFPGIEADDALERVEQTEFELRRPPDGDQPSVAVRPLFYSFNLDNQPGGDF